MIPKEFSVYRCQYDETGRTFSEISGLTTVSGQSSISIVEEYGRAANGQDLASVLTSENA